MAWVATENFDSYSDGDLSGENGGSGWGGAWSSAQTTFEVQGSVVQGGTKAMRFVSALDGDGITRPLAVDVDTGNVQFYVRRADKVGVVQIILRDSGNSGVIRVDFENTAAGGDIVLNPPTDNIELLADFALDTWYLIEMEVNCTGDSHRARVDGGTWSTAVTDFDPGAGEVNNFFTRTDQATVTNAYIDTLGVGAGQPSSVKTIGGLAIADVKTVNNLAIASVKAWNGLD